MLLFLYTLVLHMFFGGIYSSWPRLSSGSLCCDIRCFLAPFIEQEFFELGFMICWGRLLNGVVPPRDVQVESGMRVWNCIPQVKHSVAHNLFWHRHLTIVCVYTSFLVSLLLHLFVYCVRSSLCSMHGACISLRSAVQYVVLACGLALSVGRGGQGMRALHRFDGRLFGF